ncbi:amino acid permease [Steroidobacter sp. S1-65]|uniref:Arginine/agmatine antiporter n=1 Tax=Steroidobacter gossypii TaxID=2805490 RepID=A0ABS1WWP8_9GAMM|nr:amino acid permease [Steroidobacter gossypii]MBM0105405.1 amino acid permease [Steroidobacter gossypii]
MQHTNNTPAGHTGNPDALLSRELGTRQLAATIFNYTVGSGIFVLPAFAVLQLGSAAPMAYVACAIIIGLVVMCFAEAGSRVSATGGPYAYVETALGPMWGFVAGCLVLATGTSAAAGVSSVLARSILTLAPGSSVWVSRAMILVLVSTLVAINYRGVKTGARVIEAVTLAKLVPLLAFVGIGVFFIEPSNLVWTAVPEAGAVLGTAGIVIFAFSGIEGSLIPSGEVKNPSRTVPRAAFLALGAATLLYLAIQFVALGILGTGLAEDRTTPLASAAGAVVGPIGRTVLVVGAVISMFGYLSANVLSEPRGLFAMSRDGFLPRILTTVHPSFHTPHIAIVVYGVVVASIALSGTFETLAIFANLSALTLYFLCAIAAFVLRKKDVRTDGEPFLAPGGPLVPIAACLSLAWLFYETVTREQFVALLIVLGVVFALYFLRAWRLKARPA